MNLVLCPCGSKKSLEACCGRFISGKESARTPEQLMRSRYTAHALGGHGEYLVSTWLMAKELGLTAASFQEHIVHWQKLEVIRSAQRGDLEEVEFRAYFYSADAGANRALEVHHERSRFKRIKGVWYYVEAISTQ